MGALSVRELNQNISKALARVEAGERIDITRNGRVVAELRPKRPVRDALWWQTYHEMKAAMDKGVALGIEKVSEKDRYGDAEL